MLEHFAAVANITALVEACADEVERHRSVVDFGKRRALNFSSPFDPDQARGWSEERLDELARRAYNKTRVDELSPMMRALLLQDGVLVHCGTWRTMSLARRRLWFENDTHQPWPRWCP